jgi:hypothetical protein
MMLLKTNPLTAQLYPPNSLILMADGLRVTSDDLYRDGFEGDFRLSGVPAGERGAHGATACHG